ncbi:tryptophan synthase subunit alpha [Halomarina oriensis]|uniref:Tryptophan synthase alpha chain n=1 Tax=Halomarina oriensis TaxID=671145 RepID=A0A6B0GRE0_9EURY|nr:tryptophan synthase subunit alpha [Halomarina oriensis]MWG35253.1 tryptophan synthase subunit alpha [Halomarina oriensis]
MSRLDEAFADGPAFVPYLALGDPDLESSLEYIRALDRGGADVIELGLPFSEPIAEGPTIQSAVVRSLSGGMTPTKFFDAVETLDVDAPLVCMTYYNLVYQFGDEEGPRPFVERAAEVGIEGFVVPDLPAEEAGPLREACDEFGLDLIFIVAPTTRGERLERIMERTSGYVYVQARLGVTGARADVSDQTGASLDRLSRWDIPKAVGFGISSGEQAREVVSAGADGIIVGSALVDIVAEGASAGSQTGSGDVAEGHENGDPPAVVADRLETLARELKEGAVAGATRAQSERT